MTAGGEFLVTLMKSDGRGNALRSTTGGPFTQSLFIHDSRWMCGVCPLLSLRAPLDSVSEGVSSSVNHL